MEFPAVLEVFLASNDSFFGLAWPCPQSVVVKKSSFLEVWIATRAAIYRSLRALRARNRKKKVSKRVFLGVWRKVSKNTRKSLKISIFGPFWVFPGIFRDFSPDPQKDPFWDFFAISGPEPGDSCKWRLGSQSLKSYLKLRAQKLWKSATQRAQRSEN